MEIVHVWVALDYIVGNVQHLMIMRRNLRNMVNVPSVSCVKRSEQKIDKGK